MKPIRTRLSAAWQERALPMKAASFAIVGLFNFAVDFAVFLLAYYQFGWSVIPGNIAAWVVAVTSSYVMNTRITFAAESGGRLRRRDYFAFALSQTGGLAANTITVFALSYVVPVLVAKVLAIAASFAVNFTLSHRFVFRPARDEGELP